MIARTGPLFLAVFAAVALGLGAARAVTTTYVPVLLDRIADRPGLIGAVMLVNAAAGFLVPLAVGVWSDRRGGHAPLVPFMVGGGLVGAGGLVAIAAGRGTSYLMLAAAGFVTYVGLSGALTAHRSPGRDRPAPP